MPESLVIETLRIRLISHTSIVVNLLSQCFIFLFLFMVINDWFTANFKGASLIWNRLIRVIYDLFLQIFVPWGWIFLAFSRGYSHWLAFKLWVRELWKAALSCKPDGRTSLIPIHMFFQLELSLIYSRFRTRSSCIVVIEWVN